MLRPRTLSNWLHSTVPAPQGPPNRLPGANGCMKSSMMASGSSRARTASGRLYNRPGNDLTHRFPLIAEEMARLRARSCTIDGEAVACGADGIACFELIRRWDADASVFMWAFDLIELNGDDLRRDPLGVRKETLASVLSGAATGIRLNEHLEHKDGPLVFYHACKLGLEGIVSKRKDSQYSSGRSPHWIKSKNPNAPAVRREAEEDWGRNRRRPRTSSRLVDVW
jgi:bifunctional non-homologous end joining protein LigD